MLPKNRSKKLPLKMTILIAAQNFTRKNKCSQCPTEMLGEKRPIKLQFKMTALKCCPKVYPRKQLIKLSVPKC